MKVFLLLLLDILILSTISFAQWIQVNPTQYRFTREKLQQYK
ncbi:MAG: hypothetical protein ACM3O3_01345 [Syntrophothermus sp.]